MLFRPSAMVEEDLGVVRETQGGFQVADLVTGAVGAIITSVHSWLYFFETKHIQTGWKVESQNSVNSISITVRSAQQTDCQGSHMPPTAPCSCEFNSGFHSDTSSQDNGNRQCL